MTKLRVVDEIMIAAGQLSDRPNTAEFTEWQLTERVWGNNKERFGMRGFEDKYPDHKRVYMEMTGKKKHNPVISGHMARIRPNTYTLTDLGRAEYARLISSNGNGKPAEPDLYQQIVRYTAASVYLGWVQNPDYPQRASVCFPFFTLHETNGKPVNHLEQILELMRSAVRWCQRHAVNCVPPTGRDRALPAVGMVEICGVVAFIEVLKNRFADQLKVQK